MSLRTTAIALAAVTFAAVVIAWTLGGGSVELPWAPTLDLHLSFSLDGHAALYALLASGVGLAVFVYAGAYLPLHLRHQGRPERDGRPLHAWLLVFMFAMVGLVTADDLVLLFVFWDLTAIASYFLIGFDRHDPRDRYAALMALLVTGVSAVLLLVAALVLFREYGTFAIDELLASAEPNAATTTAGALLLVAALAKSAQAPLHFWLPRAMVAPTPVSAYLHSAAMVAAGVFLLGRFWRLLATSEVLMDLLLGVGIASMAVGGVLALTRDELKHVLAYSTVAQYGYVVFLLGLGTELGVAAALAYVAMHALAKCALFLTAGAVTVATGENRLSRIGGLASHLPALAAASAVAGAALVALPLTAGFFADELFFSAALDRGAGFALVSLASAVLTFGYIARFWLGLFTGPATEPDESVPGTLVAPVVVLAGALAVGGLVPSILARLGTDAAEAVLAAPVDVDVAYHLDARTENLMALATYALGVALVAARPLWWSTALAAARLGDAIGPDRMYRLLLSGLNGLSDRIHDVEVHDLRTRVAAVLVPAGILVALGTAATPTSGAYELGRLGGGDVGLALVLGAAAVAALATTLPRHHLTLVLVLSSLGFSLAVAYAFFGAPDVALVAVLVETILALAFVGVLALVPRRVLRREAMLPTSSRRRYRDPIVAVVAGLFAFVVVWSALSRPAPDESVAAALTNLASDAHAENVVTAILADFRGLDTLVEISVVAVALVGTVALLRRGTR